MNNLLTLCAVLDMNPRRWRSSIGSKSRQGRTFLATSSTPSLRRGRVPTAEDGLPAMGGHRRFYQRLSTIISNYHLT